MYRPACQMSCDACRKLEEVRGQLEALLGVPLEDGHASDNETAVTELLGLLEGRLQAQEDDLASSRQQHQEVRSIVRWAGPACRPRWVPT